MFLLIVETGIIFTSCSSEDNNTKEEDLVEIDYDKGQDYNGLHVLLQLLNEDGVAVKTFHEGKNNYFNSTNRLYILMYTLMLLCIIISVIIRVIIIRFIKV